ncbi:DUF934 domain-containing protein [Sinirhodobacter populi]|uniref:DUF934 domain-containing protein n=1 Tax=Paenirhodobacter populi TaxID=2306993 RepID=A0A443KMY5_9RHOB|nr:DUF934 domain-containing protein [Sinirhodobacter populi]RWR34149.1 DUF934 domain-containing protein [Sinirhodobacter populi]
MSVIVRDDGFHAEDFAGTAVEIASDIKSDELVQLASGADMMRILFPSFSDGRGFTLARRLRDAGYAGRLRAVGPVIADQYAMARRSGFDEVEIPDDLAARQPEEQWKFRADWRDHDYRARMKG